jgi:HPt (histidine-containing phosphotransfer) domain-containing protein
VIRAPKLWPRLGFKFDGALDYLVPQYDAEWLEHAAKQLQVTPARPLDHAIGTCLLQLADTPAALKQLNQYLQRAPQKVRALNVAVHYRTHRDLVGKGKSKKSLGHVARTWGMKDRSVKDAHRKYGKAAARQLAQLVADCTTRQNELEPQEVLAALDADMRARARLPWFKPRKRLRKNRT